MILNSPHNNFNRRIVSIIGNLKTLTFNYKKSKLTILKSLRDFRLIVKSCYKIKTSKMINWHKLINNFLILTYNWLRLPISLTRKLNNKTYLKLKFNKAIILLHQNQLNYKI